MSIHQEIIVKAAPKAVYEILTGSQKFSEMSGGAVAVISAEVGGEVSLFGGAIQARNIELVPGQRVVQTWRSADWPDGVHSLVRFELNADSGNTKLVFDQAGHPAEAESHLIEGWDKMYWTPMNALVGHN